MIVATDIAYHEQAVSARLIGADGDPRQWRWHTFGGIAEHHGQDADDEETQPPGRQHGFDHAPVKMPYDQTFDDGTNDSDRDRWDHKNGDPDIDVMVHRHRSAIAAHHHEFAMGEIDDAHHAEDDSEADTDQRQRRNRIDEVDPDNDC